jgi:hypothetical protein
MPVLKRKRCFQCNEWKSSADFVRDRATKDGLSASCKTCRAEYRAKKRSEPKHDVSGLSRTCRDCGESKPLEEFGLNVLGKFGREAHCKKCAVERGRKWKKANPAKAKTSRLMKLYRMTAAEFAEISEAQGAVCAICGEAPRGKTLKSSCLHVDHCHETGAVRGLLCIDCNIGLGRFADDERRLASAIRYLRQHSIKSPSPLWSA